MAPGLLPGQAFPSVTLPLASGGCIDLAETRGRHRLVIIYRGAFCPFCAATLVVVQDKLAELRGDDFTVVAASADPVMATAEFAVERRLRFPLACSLTEPQMHELGLYVSDPQDDQPQKRRFAEPAYFVLRPDGAILYRAESSHPMAARPDVDHVLSRFKWSLEDAKDHPELARHLWGSVRQPGGGGRRLLPGMPFPSLVLPTAALAAPVDLADTHGKLKLIVIYRGAFSPDCTATLAELEDKLPELSVHGFAVVAASADAPEVTAKLARKRRLTFPIGCSLTERHMQELGLYVSDPEGCCQPQAGRFAEPAFFVLRADGTILYRAESSHPMGARPNINHILAGHSLALQKAKEVQGCGSYTWGDVVPEKPHWWSTYMCWAA